MPKTTRALSLAHPLTDWTAADMQGPAATVAGVTVTEYLEPGLGVTVALETDETVPLSSLPAVAAHLLALAVGEDDASPCFGFTDSEGMAVTVTNSSAHGSVLTLGHGAAAYVPAAQRVRLAQALLASVAAPSVYAA